MDKLIERTVKLLIFCFWAYHVTALGVADFVPGFMTSGPTESSDTTLPIKPLVTTKRNNSASRSWYCNRTQNDGKSNVFCKGNESDSASRVITYANSEHDDKTKVVDMTSGTVQSTANQTSLLDQTTRNEMYKYNNNFTLPIKPSKNVNMNVGQNKVDFNIKY